MALKVSGVTPQGNEVWCRVESVNVTTTQMTFSVRKYPASFSQPFFAEDGYEAPYTASGQDPFTQAYGYLRGLSQFFGATWIDDQLPTPAAPTLDQAKAQQTATIVSACQDALAQVTASYPDLEVSTWGQQLAEAQSYSANSSAVTPLLTAISAASGQSVADLATGVLQKAAGYQATSGAAIGKRLALCAQIDAATTIAEVNAITW